MAWRIHDNVQRGEIDNRERGFVRGRLWFHGHAEPAVLELKGNACADLAGCRLTFENRGETSPLRPDAQFHPLQRGTVGDLTASRKVRVFDLPFAEAYERLQQKMPVPEHLANCLYLEWFSEANGRVVVESTEYTLAISPPAWTLTPEEEEQRQRDAAAGFAGFMGKLSEALEARRHEPPADKEWDEFDYEKLLRESDARTDKYLELLDKYQDHPDRDRIIAREMGWTWLEEALEEEEHRQAGRPGATADREAASPELAKQNDEDPFEVEADDPPPLEPDPATEGVDWVRTEHGDIKHPLSRRVFEGSIALRRQCKDLGVEQSADVDLGRLLSEYQITGAKLAGALDSLAYGRELRDGPFTVAYLKRALNHLHAAQAALAKVTPKNLLPADTVVASRTEFFALREEILRLMKEFRTA